MSLDGSRSPFLQHGARQPVQWMAWGEDAFERATRENRPILLDIGAVWCHWCHVMDRESYEDAETAALINELFVPVKVDRDERPDVDARYQRAVQTLTGHGGWPLTAFLTPAGEVYYGGTYFPPTDAYGRPSFKRVLREVARIWTDEPNRVQDAVRGIRDRLATYARAEAEPGDVSKDLVTHTVDELVENFDFRFGGFGSAPKFPNAGALNLLLDFGRDTGSAWADRMVVDTLDAMAAGGIHDQIGGGFHRYSVDARWIIPHFEKMSYDNGPLLDVYARAAAGYGAELYREVCKGIVDHYFDIAPDLLQAGGFPASQDADFSPDDDGDYWTWTHGEVAQALTDESLTSMAAFHFGLDDPAGAMHLDPARHVLFRAARIPALAKRFTLEESAVAERLNEIRRRLKHARDLRPRPFVDESLYTGWNALLVSGFLAAGRYAEVPNATGVAIRVLDRLWRDGFDPEAGITHRLGDREAGEYLEDQAYVAQALVDAFEVTQQEEYLERALRLVAVVRRRFGTDTGGFRDRPHDAAAPAAMLAEAQFPIADSPTPSANGVIAMVLLRLAALLHDQDLHNAGTSVLGAFGASAQRLGSAAATFVRAAAWATLPVTTVIVVGDGDSQDDELLRTALRSARPRTVIRRFSARDLRTDVLSPELQAMVTGEFPRAYVCVGNACRPPVVSATDLAEQLAE